MLPAGRPYELPILLLKPTHEPPNKQQYNRSKRCDPNRSKIKTPRGNGAPPEPRPDQAANERADDSKDYGDYAAGRVTPRNQIFREGPCNETQENPVEPERHRPTESPELRYGTRGPRVRVAIL